MPLDFRGVPLASLLEFWSHEAGEDYIYQKGKGGINQLSWATGLSLGQELTLIYSFIHKIESYNI